MLLTARDCAIIARALETACIASIGDVVGGDDCETAKRIEKLVAYFTQLSEGE